MKPLGRKYFRPPSPCKYKPKGASRKYLKGWWEDECQPDKRSDRQKTRISLNKSLTN